MVARAVPRLGGNPAPVCTALPLLESANAAHLKGQDILAAVRLREGIRRYLIANCQYEGVKLPSPGHRSPEVLVRLLRRNKVSVCCFVDEILQSIADTLELRQPGCSMRTCIEIAFELFGNDFLRGGE